MAEKTERIYSKSTHHREIRPQMIDRVGEMSKVLAGIILVNFTYL